MSTPNEGLRTILPIAGWGDTQAADVTYTGGADPVLPTPFRIGTAGAATLAAAGLAATEMWQVRTGRRQLIFAKPRRWRGPFPQSQQSLLGCNSIHAVGCYDSRRFRTREKLQDGPRSARVLGICPKG